MEIQNESLRILKNLDVLLAQGTYPGSAAPAVAEAGEFVRRMIAGIEAQQQPQPAEAPSEQAQSEGKEA